MLRDLLARFTPRDDSLAALQDAAKEADRAAVVAEAKLQELEAGLGAALLGGAAAAERHDAELRAARENAPRLRALHGALANKARDVARAERLAALHKRVEAANALAARAEGAMRSRYPELARALVAEVLVLERQAELALREARAAKDSLERELSEPVMLPIDLASTGIFCSRVAASGPHAPQRGWLGDEVRLPCIEGLGGIIDSASPIWPPRD